ncbi:hypothetical protein H8B01_28585 [Bradyrhizobium sp. Cham227]|nr:hypothetical protein [Bradyrhizobium brasilense]
MHDRVPVVGIIAAGGTPPVARFKDGMREHGLIKGENVVFHERITYGDSTKLAGYAQDMVRLRVDLIAAVGAVTARAARAATTEIPIVYSVVVQPAGDELAGPSGDPFPNMTGVTTFDDGQAAAQIALLRAIKPDLARIAHLSDAAVSECLRNASMRAAQEASLHAIDVRVAGPEPDLQAAFARMREDGTQALVALENHRRSCRPDRGARPVAKSIGPTCAGAGWFRRPSELRNRAWTSRSPYGGASEPTLRRLCRNRVADRDPALPGPCRGHARCAPPTPNHPARSAAARGPSYSVVAWGSVESAHGP